MVKVLFFRIDLINESLVIHLAVHICLSLLDGGHPPEVIWAPHFVGVELVWAPELVAVLCGVNTGVQGVFGLKA